MISVFRFVLGAAFIGALILMMWALVRFGIVSSRRTRGAAGRLRHPDRQGVERLCGFGLPHELARFYLESPLIERGEFTLVDRSRTPPAKWSVYAFHPLTPVDVREQLGITGAPGVPIADDGNKGVYYVARNGQVRVFSPNVPGRDALLSETVSDFAQFSIVEDTDDENGADD